MKVSFIGNSGAGKTSIAKLVADRYNIENLSMGLSVRDILQKTSNSPLETKIKEALKYSHWCPLPDILAIELYELITYQKGHYIIDGFPRNIDQYNSNSSAIDKVVYFHVANQTSFERVMRRKREHDNMSNWSARQTNDELNYPPLLELLSNEGKLILINADEIKSNVYSQVITNLNL
jgi:adenylate kinase family enzyme